MPLQVSHMTEEDITAFVEVDDIAMKDYPHAQAMGKNLPNGMTRKDMVRTWMEAGFKQADSTKAILKVTDTERGDELIAAAMWMFQLEPKAKDDKPAENGLQNEVDKAMGEEEPYGRFMAAMAKKGKAFEDKYIHGQPHANLAVLFTHPDHQRRGAGSMLVKWGCDKADEHGIISWLGASPAGLQTYLKQGFEVVEEYELDLRPWGVDATTIKRNLIRQPKKKL